MSQIYPHRYRRVAFLECDLGQSEFTPAGMVALTIVDKPLFGMESALIRTYHI